jgi:ElaB/YqjD/DUF883 family membrane-anchored ribosome-binding protein
LRRHVPVCAAARICGSLHALKTIRFDEAEIPMNDVNRDKLIVDLRTVVSDAEALVNATAGQAGEKIGEVRAKAEDSLRTARLALRDAEAQVVDKTKQAARATDDFVHDKPWTAVGIGAAVGLIIELLIARR